MATFTNQATLTYAGGTAISNIATGELLETLSATKTAVTQTYRAGDNVTYVVSLVNTGTTAFNDLTVTDNLGGYTVGTTTVYPLTYVADTLLYFVNGVLQPTPTITDEQPLTVTGITVPASGNVTLVYDTVVNANAPIDVDDTVTNEVTVTGNGLTTPITADETITAAATANLTISKTITPAVVTENGRVTYTLTVQNYGNTAVVATDDAVITDDFDPILTDLVVTFNGTTWEQPTNYTYNETTGLFQTVAGQITVPAATFTQNPETGEVTTIPGTAVLTVTGTI